MLIIFAQIKKFLKGYLFTNYIEIKLTPYYDFFNNFINMKVTSEVLFILRVEIFPQAQYATSLNRTIEKGLPY